MLSAVGGTLMTASWHSHRHKGLRVVTHHCKPPSTGFGRGRNIVEISHSKTEMMCVHTSMVRVPQPRPSISSNLSSVAILTEPYQKQLRKIQEPACGMQGYFKPCSWQLRRCLTTSSRIGCDRNHCALRRVLLEVASTIRRGFSDHRQHSVNSFENVKCKYRVSNYLRLRDNLLSSSYESIMASIWRQQSNSTFF